MNKNPYNGFLNVYKEKGYTSMDVCAKLRGILGMRKIGHAGTLDPMAEGVLPVALGRATKDVDSFGDGKKVYRAKLLLGKTTDTQDMTGSVISEKSTEGLKTECVVQAIQSFVGTYEQLTPMYSARKVNGKKLYEYARKGIEVERKKKTVHIYELTINELRLPSVSFTVSCSKGTYIRTLCHDIGERLGCGACMEELTRLSVGDMGIDEALRLSEIEELKDQGMLETRLRIISGCAVALGKFDGLHLGHREIIKRLKAEAQKNRLRTCVIMLDTGGGYLRQRDILKQELLSMDIDYVLRYRLSEELRSVRAMDFLRNRLLSGFSMKELIAGEDVSFGYNREGNASFLREHSRELGYTFLEVEKLRDQNGEEISSTLIRGLIRSGEVGPAAQLLGENYFIQGKVVHGRHLGGSVLGFPTMNLEVPEDMELPPFGVYAVRLSFMDQGSQESFEGIANLGKKPTVSAEDIYEGRIWLESYAFSYEGDAYGRELRVELLKFIRPERRFSDLEELRQQLLCRDMECARDFFKAASDFKSLS